MFTAYAFLPESGMQEVQKDVRPTRCKTALYLPRRLFASQVALMRSVDGKDLSKRLDIDGNETFSRLSPTHSWHGRCDCERKWRSGKEIAELIVL